MDLISKIRKELANWGDVTETAGEPLLDQSADRIEKLEAALREAVRYIDGHRDMDVGIRERLSDALST